MFEDILRQLQASKGGRIQSLTQGPEIPPGNYFPQGGQLVPFGTDANITGGPAIPLPGYPSGNAGGMSGLPLPGQPAPPTPATAPPTPPALTLPPVQPVAAPSPFTMLPPAGGRADSPVGADSQVGFNPFQQVNMGPAAMTPGGFTPGFQNIGGGGRQWAADPTEFLVNQQRYAQSQGVNPLFTAGSVLQGNQAAADNSLKGLLTSQSLNSQQGIAGLDANTRLQATGMQGQTQRDVAGLENQGRLATAQLGVMGQLAGAYGQNPNMDPKLIQAFGGMLGGASPAPAGGPVGSVQAGPGVPPAPGGAIAPLAALAGDNEAMRPIASFLGTGDLGPGYKQHEAIGPANIDQLLNHLQGMPPEKLQALVGQMKAGKFGDPTKILNALGQRTAAQNLLAQPPTDPAGRPLDLGSAFNDPNQIPGSYAIAGEGGKPIFTLGAQPRSALGKLSGVFGTGTSPYATMTLGNGQTIPVTRGGLMNAYEANPLMGAKPNPADFGRRANTGNELLRLWQMQGR